MIDEQGGEVGPSMPALSDVPVGPELAAALAAGVAGIETLDLSESSRGRLVDLALAAEQVKAWAIALQAKATAALVEQFETAHEAVCARERDFAHEQAMEATTLSLSLALGISLRAADKKVALAQGLDAHPELAQALAAARIDDLQAAVIHEHALSLPGAKADRLVTSVVADPTMEPAGAVGLVKELRDGTTVWSIPAHKLRPILTAAVADLAPETLEPVAEVVRRDRHVAHYATTIDRPGALVLHGPDHLLAAMHSTLDRDARAARKAGAPETLDQLRFDLAVGAITSGAFGLTLVRWAKPGAAASQATPADNETAPGDGRTMRLRGRPPSILINITVPDTTLMGLDNRPAVLHTPSGDVPISAELARALAYDADHSTWRRILCDSATGTATEVSRTYQPGVRLKELCRVRDGHTSRFPTSAARTIELDHIEEFDHEAPEAGGLTTSTNLAAAGKRDHQAKTGRLMDVTGDANGELTYTTGTGHTYTSRPHQYLEPTPPPTPPPTPTEEAPDNGDPPY
jgi:hypothetical protein